MPSGYHHLTYGERCQIYALRKSGLSDLAIARQIGRDRTTVRREIRRNGGGRGCRHGQAQAKASARRGAASSVAGKMTRERWRTVEDRLAEGWSPEQIAGRFRKEGIPMAGREWICQYVRADRKAGGRLFLFLRRRGRKPDRKGGRHSGRGRIPDRTDISERPAVVEAKERVGGREEGGAFPTGIRIQLILPPLVNFRFSEHTRTSASSPARSRATANCCSACSKPGTRNRHGRGATGGPASCTASSGTAACRPTTRTST